MAGQEFKSARLPVLIITIIIIQHERESERETSARQGIKSRFCRSSVWPPLPVLLCLSRMPIWLALIQVERANRLAIPLLVSSRLVAHTTSWMETEYH